MTEIKTWTDESQHFAQPSGNRAERRRKEKLSRQLTKELKSHGVTDPQEVEAIKRKAGLA